VSSSTTALWFNQKVGDGLLVKVAFDVGTPPKFPIVDYLEGNDDPIAGRPSATIYNPGAEQCNVETGHIPFDDAAGATGLLEMVLVSADAPPGRGDRMDEACAGVLTIARTLLPRLPSA
jgi:hypothetical protein